MHRIRTISGRQKRILFCATTATALLAGSFFIFGSPPLRVPGSGALPRTVLESYAELNDMETDYRNLPNAVQFCTDASGYDPSERCFQEMALYAGFHFHPGSREFLQLCDSLPERWKQQCASAP